MKSAYCSMIHGGLHLEFNHGKLLAQHCCLRKTQFQIDTNTNFWNNQNFNPLRETNKSNKWDAGCNNCERLENSGHVSMRMGMNDGCAIQDKTELSGPVRIDLMFDISCNLACRTCGPGQSTFWQKHLKEHNLWKQPIFNPKRSDEVIHALAQLDLSNLKQLVFCGGETMLGQAYWDVTEWLANNVPRAKQQLTVCFQTNGTQPILDKNYKIIEKLHLVKMHISLDGVEDKFEYLRWPANWNQVTDNLLEIRQTAPSNVMFLIEETISIFNLWYTNDLAAWAQQNFITNREGDLVDHTKHLAVGEFSLMNCSTEYVAAMKEQQNKHLVPTNWKENTEEIRKMIKIIKNFDQLRNQSFETTFPDIAKFYSRFL